MSDLNISQYPQSDMRFTWITSKLVISKKTCSKTGNNLCLILWSSLVNSWVNSKETPSTLWQGKSSSKAARKLQLGKCRLLLTRQHTTQSYSVNFIFADSYNNPALILQAVNQWRSISLMTKCWNAKAKFWASENSFWMKLLFLFALSCGSGGFHFTYLSHALCFVETLWPNRPCFRRRTLMCQRVWKWLSLFPVSEF